MKIFCYENKQLAGVGAAQTIVNVVKNDPEAVLGLATGSSPIPMYNSLIERYKSGEVSFKKVKSVNLDEYVGLQPTHPMSYAYFMRENLFDSIDIELSNTNVPSGVCTDPAAECLRYDALIESLGGVDVQVLGIGHNGHIAFNEPSDTFSEGTQCVTLTDSTIDANARFFNSRDDVPKYAISMGIGAICKSKKIILVANGSDKAHILEKALFGEVTPWVPASVLKTLSDVEVHADREALSVILEKHPESVIFA
jgi:glucosamine-6-phosphate deaminase